MRKNDVYKAEISGLTSEGFGVARVDGMAVFVPYAIPGELVSLKIVKVNKSYAYGKLISIEQESPHRIKPECPVFYRCGGCGLQHMTYERELEFKTDKVLQLIRRTAGLDAPVEPCVGSPEISGYRNKAQYPVGMKDNEITAGFFAKRSHDLVSSDNCIIQNELSRRCVSAVIEYMKNCGVAPYCEETGRGRIRHIYVRCSKKQALLTLVVNGRSLPATDDLVAIVLKHCPEVCGIVLNVNTKKTNVVLGQECITLWGKDSLTDILCDIEFEISPKAFYQVNHAQTERLYAKAKELANLTGKETVLDLYCGIGTISLFMADSAKQVYGVEIVPDAIKNAIKNAERNGISNVEFFVGDAKDAAAKIPSADVVITDPPRAGCDREVIDHILRIAPKRIVYISCNPATLARDLKIFDENGYKTVKVCPYDLFPRTEHIESVALLTLSTAI